MLLTVLMTQSWTRLASKHYPVCSHRTDLVHYGLQLLSPVPACNDEELAENLRRCKGIIRWLVFPSTENPDDESQEKLACMQVELKHFLPELKQFFHSVLVISLYTAGPQSITRNV